jgi:hypothetical protein
MTDEEIKKLARLLSRFAGDGEREPFFTTNGAFDAITARVAGLLMQSNDRSRALDGMIAQAPEVREQLIRLALQRGSGVLRIGLGFPNEAVPQGQTPIAVISEDVVRVFLATCPNFPEY